MNDETKAISKTLQWTIGMIMQSEPRNIERISLAYQEACVLVGSIPKDNGDARPRIVACFGKADLYRAVDDVASVGWILMAIQERVNEQTLRHWRQLSTVVENTVKMLPLSRPTVH